MHRSSWSFLALLVLPSCGTGRVPRADSIRIAVPYEVSTLDPHAETKLGNMSVLTNIYEPLVTTDADMRIQPCLAETWESPDLLTWLFHLRKSVSFHDGRAFHAADAVYSLNRVLRDDSLGMHSALQDVSDVTAVDDVTLRVRTARPSPILLNKLSAVLIVPEAATADALGASANGTGPYVVAEWKPGERLLLNRHEGHWMRPRPRVREVAFSLGRPPEEAVEGLLAGKYQLIQCDSKKTALLVERSSRTRVVRRSNLYVKYLGYDLRREATPFCGVKPNPFRNVLVRRAIHMAVDRHFLVSELSSYAVPALQPVPRFVFGFNPKIPEAQYDKEAARELLRQAGLERGFEVVLHARRIFEEAAQLVREELGPVGIQVEVRALPDAEFFGLLGRGEASFWLNRFGCSSGDASDFLDDAVHSRVLESRFGAKNYGGYANPDLDRAIERVAALELERRRNALQSILATVVEDLVWIPLYNDQDVYGIDRSLAWEPRGDSFIRASEITPRP